MMAGEKGIEMSENAKNIAGGAGLSTLESPQQMMAREYYYKLWKCLKKALADDKLACHCNNIVVHLGKSVESSFTYYNAQHDAWCDYFLG